MSVIQVITGSDQQAVPLRELRQIYIKKSILVHSDKNGSDVMELAATCMQNLARAYELCKEFAETTTAVDSAPDLSTVITNKVDFR